MMIPEAFEGRDDLPDHLQGLLRLPLLPDGAVGRPRRGRVHRRPRDRRDARPQRPAPRPLAGDQGRLGRARLGDRRDGRAGLQHRPQGPPAARQALPRRPRARAGSSPTRRSSARSPTPAALRRAGTARASSTSPTCPTPSRAVPRTEPLRDAPARVRLHAGGPARAARRRPPRGAAEPIGSMGNDLALAVLSDRQPPLFSYFKQLFAQVTNPPIDPIREAIVMSVGTGVGSERNLLDETPEHAHQLVDGHADPAHARAREAAPGRLARSSRRTRSTSRGRSATGPDGHGAAPSSASARRPSRRSPAASTSSSSPTATSAPSARRSRRCWRSPPSTTTSCARARACRPGSCSSPASRARSTTSRR